MKSKKRKNKIFFYLTIVGLMLFSTVVFYFNRPSSAKLVYHGPYIKYSMPVESTHVLGQYVANLNNDVLNDKDLLRGSFGIAAGSVLVNLNQADLDKYFASMNSLGIKWVRWDFDWSVIQARGKNYYNWASTDRVVQTANNHGIKTLGIITYTPKWARSSGCISNFACAPANSDNFADFAGKVALRYKDTVNNWEIWNEPNIPIFFAPKSDPVKYFDILKKSSIEIKRNSPNAIVISGGLAPSATNSNEGSYSPYDFISMLYSIKGFSQHIDALALHPYTYPYTPEYPTYWNGWKEMLAIRKIMVKNGDNAKKIWITEFGAATGGPGVARDSNSKLFSYGTDYMTEKSQLEMMEQSVDQFKSNHDWIEIFFWYSLRDMGISNTTPENFFGLLKNDWSEKPSYRFLKNNLF